MRVGQGARDWFEQQTTIGYTQLVLSLQQRGQTVAFDQFHGNIGNGVLHLPHAQCLYNVGMGKVADGARFGAEALAQNIIGAWRQYFERDRLIRFRIDGAVNRGHRAAAQAVNDPIAVKGLWQQTAVARLQGGCRSVDRLCLLIC